MTSPPPGPPQGMRDFLPDSLRERLALADRIRAVYAKYGYAPIETPALERLEVLKGKGGGENEMLLFEVLKRGEKLEESRVATEPAGLADLGLRFDLTVPLARFYALHRARLPAVFRAQHIGPVWRAERPQKGRFREFVQCDVDAIGSASPALEAEVILATSEVFRTLLGDGFRVVANDRQLLTSVLNDGGVPPERHETALIAIDKLDKVGEEGVRKELAGRAIQEDVLKRLQDAKGWGWDHPRLARLKAVRDLAPDIAFDPFLARGLGYYTGPVFEVRHEGMAGALAGGGRYDGLIGRFLGTEVPAVGFSIGFERLLLVLKERGIGLLDAERREVFLPLTGTAQAKPVAALAHSLRAKGIPAVVQPDPGKLGAQLKMADEILHCPLALIVEADGRVTIKNLRIRQSSSPLSPEQAVEKAADLLRAATLPPATP